MIYLYTLGLGLKQRCNILVLISHSCPEIKFNAGCDKKLFNTKISLRLPDLTLTVSDATLTVKNFRILLIFRENLTGNFNLEDKSHVILSLIWYSVCIMRIYKAQYGISM